MLKNFSKKAIIALLIVSVLLVTPLLSVSADGAGLTFTSKSSYSRGTEVICSFTNYTPAKPIDYLQVTINGDKTMLTYVENSLKNYVSSSDIDMTYNFSKETGELVVIYEPNKAGNACIPTSTTKLFSFRLESGKAKEYTVNADYVLCYTDSTDSEVKSSIKVTIPLFGDVNNDSLVNLKDLIRYKKYIADKSTAFEKVNADLTGNATYGADDLVILRQIIVGLI